MITFIRTLILYTLVITVMRLMGKRQIGQLQPFELVVAIMISELASIPMGNTGIPLLQGVIPILTLLFAQIVVSILTIKSNVADKIISGKPTVVIQNGKINVTNLERELYTISDLVEQLRIKNIPSLEDVEFAILESSGNISFIPKTAKRPPTLEDLNISGSHQGLNLPVIIDGRILLENLEPLQIDLGMLHNILGENNILSPKKIIYASLDTSGNFFYQSCNMKEDSKCEPLK
jgi:uncharacterized membrane protein YcaP (DUF421 family)